MSHQSIKVLNIFLVIAAILLSILFLTDNFRIDTNHATPFGVYDSSLAGLPAYYNPVLNTVSFLEYSSLVLLPLVLFIGGTVVKSLRNIPVFPLTVLALTLLFAAYIWPHALALGGDAIDPTVSSELPYFLRAQIPLVVGLANGYVALRIKGKHFKI